MGSWERVVSGELAVHISSNEEANNIRQMLSEEGIPHFEAEDEYSDDNYLSYPFVVLDLNNTSFNGFTSLDYTDISDSIEYSDLMDEIEPFDESVSVDVSDLM